jgi:hypothetical protein
MRMSFVVAAACLILSPGLAEAQVSRPGLAWRDLGARTAGDEARGPIGPNPGRYRSYAIPLDQVRTRLSRADLAASTGPRGVEITLPRPDGRLERFRAIESPVLGPEMRRMLPDVRTYSAQGIDDPSARARIDLTRLGLRAYVLTSEGTYAVDPLIFGRTDRVMSHWSRDGSDLDAPFHCEVAEVPQAVQRVALPAAVATPAGDTLRTYRFTLTTGGEYTQFFGGDTLVALAEMATVVNRVNAVYERDLAIHLDAVWLKAFPDPATDPFPNGSSISDLSTYNQLLVDSLVGPANYDLGIVLNKISALGHNGVGFLPAVCEPGFNASTVITSGNPIDLSTYRIVMHEMGHNFFSVHDWDAPCNRMIGLEPGSGSTIMGRAGRCPPWNIQAECDHYFGGYSMQEILAYVRSIPECGSRTPTGNAPPSAEAGPDYTIPRQTPFILTGQGSDPDPADTLTYCWEQMDDAATPFDLTLGPLVRSRPPSPSPVRHYPLLENVLTNVIDPWDKLPTVNRIMTMRLTVRGASVGFGGHAWDEMVITVAGNPLVVTSPNGGETVYGAVPLNVTWNVGGSATLSPTVNILLSRDGGYTWAPLVLGTPNDGAESVVLSAPADSTCRIKIESVGNIFYDVSNANFRIGAPPVTVDPGTSPARLALRAPEPNPSAGGVTLRFDLPLARSVELAVYTVQGRRVRVLASGSRAGGRHAVTWDGRDDAGLRVAAGVYYVRLQSDGREAVRRLVRLE